MNKTLSRRRILRGAAAGVLVFGFDPVRRTWITDARAQASALCGLPPLDGTLRVDATALQLAADDFGHIVHRTPIAVLEPGSIDDIAKIVRYARMNGLKVAMRGQGHATFGQAQVDGGIVIDSSALATIHEIANDHAVVDAGVQWADLVRAAYAKGRTPPVLTDYLELSIGGTLSLGGIGGASSHFGAQVDNVIEIEVVTGRGDRETCSRERNRRLFEAVLAGLGQCAFIVRATVRLVAAKTTVRVFDFFYADIATYVRDQRMLLSDGRFDYLEGQVVPNASGPGFRYMIEAATFYTPPAAPDPATLLAGLSDDASARQSTTESYLDFAFRIEPLVAFLKSIGAWASPHPWFAVFVPVSSVEKYVGDIVARLTPADTGGGPVLFYPFRQDRLRQPLFRVPSEDFFTFNLLRFAPPSGSAVAAMLADNRVLYDAAVAAGGTQYPLGSIPLTPADWRLQFGEAYDFIVDAKGRFDPDHVLTPGQGIFERTPL